MFLADVGFGRREGLISIGYCECIYRDISIWKTSHGESVETLDHQCRRVE
jgi:hypothetical protein